MLSWSFTNSQPIAISFVLIYVSKLFEFIFGKKDAQSWQRVYINFLIN